MATRVLIVDDSATMRGLLTAILSKDPEIDVVGSAADPYEARDEIKRLDPDVVTLDIELPRMNGIEFLEKIMTHRPTPVIMISSHTASGSELSVKALAKGAFDCVCKPGVSDPDSFAQLNELVKAAAASRIGRRRRPAAATEAMPVWTAKSQMPIVIGASTGGVEALTTLFSTFPEDCPPTFVVQHMPPGFTASLAQRLNAKIRPRVVEATHHMTVSKGMIAIAPAGDRHMSLMKKDVLHCRLRAGERVNGHCPSVDVLFNSACDALGGDCVAVLLTGMGSDGAEGLLSLRRAGAVTLGQDKATSVVYGMSRTAKEIGAVCREVPIRQMGNYIEKALAGQLKGDAPMVRSA